MNFGGYYRSLSQTKGKFPNVTADTRTCSGASALACICKLLSLPEPMASADVEGFRKLAGAALLAERHPRQQPCMEIL